MPPGNQPREPAGAGSRPGTACAVFHLDTTSSWVYLIWKGNPEPIPLPQTSQDDKEQTRRKFFLMIQYILELRRVAAKTAYENECRKKYTPINQFFKEHDFLPEQQKHRFAQVAENLFLVHLGQARIAAQARAGELGCRITRLLVPVPSTWTRWMRKCYAAYFRITWKLDPEFIYESEATAHFVSKSMIPGREGKILRKFIIVDLGAQSLSMSTFHLAANRTNPASFHLYSDPNNTSDYSGTDLHAERTGSIICSYIDANKSLFSKSNEEKLGKKFTASYEDADETKVVLAGVGFQNRSIRGKVKKQVEAQGFLLYDSSDFGLDTTQPSIVAIGAACAIVNASSVEEFMQTARFVVQASGGTKTSKTTIWSSGSSRTAQVSVSEADEKLIVKCSPVPKTSPASGIDAALFYDFAELKLPAGNYQIRMLSTNGYSVTISYKDTGNHADDGRETKDGSQEYRIYYDYRSRLCFEDIDKSASRGKNDQATVDSEELEKLLDITDEELEAKILARTKYRTVAASRATLSAL